jgi:formate dehydrogenase maturation protein FdhE
MKLFVDDDLSRGMAATSRNYCDACQRARPAAGFIQYDRYAICNCCATEYEVARARGTIASPGQFVRDKHFGEGEAYALGN